MPPKPLLATLAALAAATAASAAEFQPSFPDAVAGDARESSVDFLVYPPPRERAMPQARRQPQGALSGKFVYVGAGHGWTYDDAGNLSQAWFTQRPNTNGIVEDYGNIEQAAIFARLAWNAGATVVPTRPIGWQRHEVVLDQHETTPGPDGVVVYSGVWGLSDLAPFHSKGDDPESYRFASTTSNPAGPTATARYIPNIPETGEYPVYTWVLDGSNRVAQEYRIAHAGGVESVRVDHRGVGKGWVWLGSFVFEEGSSGFVEITNWVPPGESGVVIADGIRFGNGMGDLDFGQGPSGFPREEEQSRYWAQASQMPPSIWDTASTHAASNVSTPPRMAAYMNNESFVPPRNAVYIGFHSNAGGGRGAVGLSNENDGPQFAGPHQTLLATLTAREINQDMRQLDTRLFPHYPRWSARTNHVYMAPFAYGEIRRDRLNDEMEATIVEVAFHDSPEDARYLGCAKARTILAESTLRGVVRFFEQAYGEAHTLPPPPPTELVALNAPDEKDAVLLSWSAPEHIESVFPETPGGVRGDPPTEYAVLMSTNGLGFTRVATVAGTHARISGLAPGGTYFFRVQSANAGGRSLPGNTAGARIANGDRAKVLLVDGFTRIDDFLSRVETVSGDPRLSNLGSFLRPIPRHANDRASVIPAGQAIARAPVWSTFDSATSAAVLDGRVDLHDYRAVYWLLGEESTRNETFSPAEQVLAWDYLNGGGALLATGAEIGWDLDREGFSSPSDRLFFQNAFRASFVRDDAGAYTAFGVAGSPFEGMWARFDDGAVRYDVDYPDVFAARPGGQAVLRYGTPQVQHAAVFAPRVAGGRGPSLLVGFPLESIVESNGPWADEAPAADLVGAALLALAGSEAAGSVWMLLGD